MGRFFADCFLVFATLAVILVFAGFVAAVDQAERDAERERVAWTKKEPEDRVKFESFFGVPSRRLEGDDEASRVKHVRVVTKLRSLVDALVKKQSALKSLREAGTSLSYEEQMARITALNAEMDTEAAQFIEYDRLAGRFDYTPVDYQDSSFLSPDDRHLRRGDEIWWSKVSAHFDCKDPLCSIFGD